MSGRRPAGSTVVGWQVEAYRRCGPVPAGGGWVDPNRDTRARRAGDAGAVICAAATGRLHRSPRRTGWAWAWCPARPDLHPACRVAHRTTRRTAI